MKRILPLFFLMALICTSSWGQTTTVLTTGFEGGLPSGWLSTNAGLGSSWIYSSSLFGSARSGTYAAEYRYNANNAANAWFISSGVSLTAGSTYTINYYQKVGSDFFGTYPEKLKVTVGTSQTVAAQTTTLQTATYTNTSYSLRTISFIPTTSGTYYFGWNCFSDKDEYFLDVDDITITTPIICTTPTKPTGVVVSSNSSTSFSGTITPSSPTPTGYLVVTSTSSSLSAQPANGTTYSQGDNIGGGKVQYVGTTTSYTTSQALASNTNYYVFVYAYNAGCSGAPYYSTTFANTSIATCSGQVTGLTASSVAYNGFTLGWTAPAGNATLSYTVDVSTSSSFLTHVTGYPATQSGTSKSVTGLSANTTYYYSVTASNTNSSCTNTAVTGSVPTPLPPCSGAPTAGTASAGTSSFCTSGSTTLTLNGYTSNAAGIALQWYKSTDNSTFTPIAGATNATLSTGIITATTYYYCKVSCSGSGQSVNSNTVSVSISYTPVISTQPVAQQVCTGSPFTLSVTATNATGYQWKKDGTNITGATNAAYTVTSASASDDGSYTVVVSGSSPCGSVTSSPAVITVNPAVSGVAASASSNLICAGSPVTLTALPASTSSSLVSQNFNSGLGSWTAFNNSFGGSPANAAWTTRGDGYSYNFTTFHSNDNSRFIISNSDAQGIDFGFDTWTQLVSPSFSTIGLTSCSLNFYQYFPNYSGFFTGDYEAAVLISTNGGSTWTTVHDFINDGTVGSATAFANSTLDLSAYIGHSSVKIMFEYGSTWGMYWALDNINITGGGPTYSYAWTSAPAGFTSTVQQPGVSPSVSTTYNVTVKNNYNCTATASTIVTVNQKSTNPTSATATFASICTGQSTTLTLNGGGGGTGATIKWYRGSCGGTLVGSGNNLSVSPTANTTYYGRYEDGAPCNNNTSCAQVAITVSPVSVGGSVSGGTTICSGSNSGTLSLSAYTGSIVRWESSVNGGNSWTNIANTTSSQSYTNLTQTTQYKALVQSGACSSSYSTTATITVKTSPTASISPVSSSACAGQSVAVDITGTTGASITYNVNSGTPQTMTLPIATINSPANTGNYIYTLTAVTLNGCTGTFSNNSATIDIHALPDATISGNNYVQIGNQITLTGASSGGNWSSGNTSAATVTNSTGVVTGGASGTSIITYTIPSSANQYGCSNSATKPITITADYVTRNNGNFSNINTWKHGTVNGFVNATVIPASVNTIEVQHDLTLDQDFQVGTNKSFVMSAAGTMLIQPGKIFSGSGSIDFGHKHVTVQSDASGTGAIGQMATAIANADNVTVERYTDAGNNTTGRRAWRLVTSPVTGKTIHESWQEGSSWTGLSSPAQTGTYGTLITGEGLTPQQAQANGFDYVGGGNHTSIKQYTAAAGGGNWGALPGNSITGTNVSLSSQPAWLLFVRGDRTVNTTTGKGIAILRATGTLNQGAKTITVDHNTPYTLVGNPYAAPINFDNIYNSSISNTFVIWNSQQGVYGAYNFITKEGNGSYTMVPFNATSGITNNNAKYIQSGSGFFVAPASTSNDGSITINESAKNTSAAGGISTFRESAQTDRKLWINLNLKNSDTSAVVADGVLTRFDNVYSADIDADDALKQSNPNENLSIGGHTNNLMIEARPDIVKTDTVQLKLWNVTKRNYQLQLMAANFGASAALQAYVEDNYLGTKQEVNLQGTITTINFSVTSDSSSYKSDRFRIVFQNNSIVALPVTLTNVKASAVNNGVNVSWTVANEVNMKGYTVERSTDGGRTYVSVATQAAKNGSGATAYNSFDAKPKAGDNVYRIRMEAKDGVVSYSSSVKVNISNTPGGVTAIAVYPNPVRESKAHLQLTNLQPGAYLASLYSEGGQVVYQKKITISQANAVQSEDLYVGKGLAQGSYRFAITDSRGAMIKEIKLMIAK